MSPARSTTPRVVATATASVPVSFVGLSQAEACPSCEPPDSWVAVSPTYVIQTTNSVFRISNRAGGQVQTIPDWAFFGLTSDQFGSDARMLWDAVHARWIATDLSFNATLDDNFVNIAVSETSDPLGVWDEYFLGFGTKLPDYPGVASSSDKVVISEDEFDTNGTVFDGASMLIIPWTIFLSPGSGAGVWYTGPNSAAAHIRPAQLLSPSSDVHIIWEDVSPTATVGHVDYQKVRGTGASITFPDFDDLTADGAVAATSFTAPVDPRQSGSPATIANMGDERPTDAVWRLGQLWFVSTVAVDFGGGFGPVDGALAQGVMTTASTPTTLDSILGAADTQDRFMGGIGLAGNGDVVLTYSESSASEFVSTRLVTKSAVYGSLTESTIDESGGTYAGTRWGDYVGVAADPVGSSAVWLTSQTSAADGTWATRIERIVSNDYAPPTDPTSAPKAVVVSPSSLATFAAPVRISWGASADLGSGVDHYDLEFNLDGAGFETGGRFADRVSGTSAVRSLNIGFSYQFRVRAVDAVGNVSAWITGPVFTPTVIEQTKATFSTGWSTSSSASYSGGSVKYAKVAGKTAQFSFSGRAVAFVTTKGSSRGSVKVYIDGVYKGTVSTYRSSTLARQIVFQYSWSTAGSHKIKLVVVGTSGHPRVDVDAIVVLH